MYISFKLPFPDLCGIPIHMYVIKFDFFFYGYPVSCRFNYWANLKTLRIEESRLSSLIAEICTFFSMAFFLLFQGFHHTSFSTANSFLCICSLQSLQSMLGLIPLFISCAILGSILYFCVLIYKIGAVLELTC